MRWCDILPRCLSHAPRRRPAGGRHVLLLLVLAVVATPLVAYRAVDDTPLSIYDEWQYADRVHAVSEGHLFMRDGETSSRWARSPAPAGASSGSCGPTTAAPARATGRIRTPNYAAADPPPYFLVDRARRRRC